MRQRYLIVAFLLTFTACTPQAVSPTPTLPSPQLTVVTSVPPTLTPSPTPVTTTEEWIYPYTIAGLREHDYQGGEINIGDPVALLHHLFTTPTIRCEDAGDANDDGNLNVADPVTLLNYLFGDGFAPAAPFPGCGRDRTGDELTCGEYDHCP